jgi:hypothetical protein
MLLGLLWFCAAGFAWAQESETTGEEGTAPQAGPEAPEETEIKLPETLLEVEELAVEEITAELPESPDVPIRPIDVPLPEEQDLEVAQGAFALPAPSDGATVPQQEDRSSYFASGVLSAGSMSHIEGALSLSKLGADPRLRFQFSHEGLDGYHFNDAGTGYFRSQTYIDGFVAGALGAFETEGGASFREEEEGLQTNPDFYSTDTRFVEANTSAVYTPTDNIELVGRLDGTIANRVLTIKAAETTPPRATEYVIKPSFESTFTIQDASLSADLWYQYQFATGGLGDAHSLALTLAGDAPISSELFVGGDVGVYWPISGGVQVPFHLSVTGTVEDLVTLGISAGYEAGPRTLFETWREDPLLVDTQASGGSGPSALADRRAWVADAELSWNILARRLVLAGGVGFAYDETARTPQAYAQERGVFPVEQQARTTVTPKVALTYRIGAFSTELSWRGNFVEKSPFDPLHQFGLTMDVATDDRGVTGSLEVASPFFPQAAMPIVRGEVGFRIVEGLRILASVDDPLAPILENGRPRYGAEVNDAFPFIAPGFRFALSTEISL